ncbi:MAG TPA: Rap1a/Tai family immunity protein [Acetobacteraceae bacterium]|jgi:hypothetical protein|nr:Rap1a/Tai family immunity protein [Acetobacteraceae bacterium]
MKPTTLLAAAALIIAPSGIGTARAQAVSLHARTAGDLAGLCSANPRDSTGPARLNYCDGFAQGAVDVELMHAGGTKPFCIPPGTKREVTLHEFASWVRANPSRESEAATSGLFHFLAERYPCK